MNAFASLCAAGAVAGGVLVSAPIIDATHSAETAEHAEERFPARSAVSAATIGSPPADSVAIL